MINDPIIPLQELTWKEIRDEVTEVNQPLATIIDRLDPGKNFKLLQAIYSFGDLILKEGVVQLPQKKGAILSLTDAQISRSIKEQLDYASTPLFLTLENCNEVFMDTGTRVIPFTLFNPGSLVGLSDAIDFMGNRKSLSNKWSVAAGARSIFILPKINEASGYKRLRIQYGLPSTASPHSMADHWQLFMTIANHPKFNQPWKNKILYFTKEWLLPRPRDPAWVAFHNYLFHQAWSQVQLAREKIDLSLIWESFTHAISTRRLKPTPYLVNQVKHIMLITTGKWPGFRPADDSQLVAPTRGLQEMIMNVYQLKHYLPTIMHAHLFKPTENLPVYYSLAHPTLVEGSPHHKSSSTLMLNLREIKLLLEILVRSATLNKKCANNLFKNIQFNYFHVEPDKYEEIYSSKLIPHKDPGFSKKSQEYENRLFCATSPFWRGCIRIISYFAP